MQLKIYKCCFPQCSTCALCKVIKLGDFCITKITKSTVNTLKRRNPTSKV